MERILTTGSIGATDTKDTLRVIRDNISTLGWTVIDDMIESNSYVVIKSEGHEKNNKRAPCYLKCIASTFNIILTMYLYWDNTTHIGYSYLNYNSSYKQYTIGICCNDDSTASISLTGNKDIILFSASYAGIRYDTYILRIDNPSWNIIGNVQADVSSGSDVILQLDAGQASDFKLGSSYRMLSPYGYADRPTVTEIDLTNDTIKVSSLVYNFAQGSYIGNYPYPWIGFGLCTSSYSASYSPVGLPYAGISFYSTGYVAGYNNLSSARGVLAPTDSQDTYNGNSVSMYPYTFYEESQGVWGTNSYLHYCSYGSDGDVIGVNEHDVATVTSGTLNKISDDNKSWLTDVFKGMTSIILSGENEDTVRYIESNTANTLTVDPPFPTTISGGESFAICEAFYIRKNKPISCLAFKAVY